MPAVLLVGGLGTRLRTVLPGTPKPLAPVGGAPFLELLIRQLRVHGIRRIVLCTGHLAEQVESEFGDGSALDVWITHSKETEPLGTAGAVKLAERHLGDANEFVVMNGDSFLEMNVGEFVNFHRGHGGVMSMAVREVQDASRYGTVEMNGEGRVIAFREKMGIAAAGKINGGVYVFQREILEDVPERPGSLEKDIFPRLIERGIYAQEQRGMFIDIGTPEDYARAQTLCSDLYAAAQTDRGSSGESREAELQKRTPRA